MDITEIFQIAGKNILATFRNIFIILLRYFKIIIYLLHYFSRNSKLGSVESYGPGEPSLRNTVVD